jgi:DNA-binding MarR family transcriptional regulator
MDKSKSIDHALRATWQAVAKMYNEEASKHDVTMAVAMALLNIDYKNGTPSTSLGPSMGMEATSLSRILKNMEERGFIYREKNLLDRRSICIKLTKLGIEKREFSKSSVNKFNKAIRENLPEEKINNFFEVVETVNRLISQKAIFINE